MSAMSLMPSIYRIKMEYSACILALLRHFLAENQNIPKLIKHYCKKDLKMYARICKDEMSFLLNTNQSSHHAGGPQVSSCGVPGCCLLLST